jgi:hypothetical protein
MEEMMLKATGKTSDGKELLIIGLSFGNLRKFMSEPMDTFIRIDGKEVGLPMDVLIFSGETEAHMAKYMENSIGRDTIVHIDPKLKS